MYRRNDDIILRRIHGSIFLIDITDKYLGDKCALYEINEIGEFIWKNISEQKSVDKLTNKLKSVIVDEIDYEVLYKDIQDFISELRIKNFLVEVA